MIWEIVHIIRYVCRHVISAGEISDAFHRILWSLETGTKRMPLSRGSIGEMTLTSVGWASVWAGPNRAHGVVDHATCAACAF